MKSIFCTFVNYKLSFLLLYRISVLGLCYIIFILFDMRIKSIDILTYKLLSALRLN